MQLLSRPPTPEPTLHTPRRTPRTEMAARIALRISAMVASWTSWISAIPSTRLDTAVTVAGIAATATLMLPTVPWSARTWACSACQNTHTNTHTQTNNNTMSNGRRPRNQPHNHAAIPNATRDSGTHEPDT